MEVVATVQPVTDEHDIAQVNPPPHKDSLDT